MKNLNARDLRISNWVNLHKDNNPNVFKPYQIDSGFDLYKLDESNCYDISPIHLTEDILLKWCGATKLKAKSGFIASYKLGRLTINVSSSLNYYYRGKVYNNLHQLQNLYEILEQEELKINL